MYVFKCVCTRLLAKSEVNNEFAPTMFCLTIIHSIAIERIILVSFCEREIEIE